MVNGTSTFAILFSSMGPFYHLSLLGPPRLRSAGCESVDGGVNVSSEGEDLTHKPFGPKMAIRGDTALVALDLRRGLAPVAIFSGFG